MQVMKGPDGSMVLALPEYQWTQLKLYCPGLGLISVGRPLC